VNVSIDEIIRYSPQFIDVINLKDETFETVSVEELLRKYGKQYPMLNDVVSVIKQDFIRPATLLGTDFANDSFVINFDGLVKRTTFLGKIKEVLALLEKNYGHPVDIEFAHNGHDFYLLQCRSQSYHHDNKPAVIPENIEPEKTIFTANKYVPNGLVSGIKYIVYVDPEAYSGLKDYQDLVSVGKAIGMLNQLLPKRQFILMGPGRWGSRGDIKLGVSITYSDIHNTALLIEIARQKKEYVPDVSFGTHFFQDLVEANIKYLPLYPDERGTVFNEEFLNASNIISSLLPEMNKLKNVISVIDIQEIFERHELNVCMNAEQEKAVGIIVKEKEPVVVKMMPGKSHEVIDRNIHWQWRLRNVEKIAAKTDPVKFGIAGFYVFGSTKNGTAREESDIDILIHFRGDDHQRRDLLTWLDGWSLSLSQVNYERTGRKTSGLLDVHIVTDKDIEARTSYAVKIGAVTDAARPLRMGTDLEG
jgi:predicted nucleotidyltransferase